MSFVHTNDCVTYSCFDMPRVPFAPQKALVIETRFQNNETDGPGSFVSSYKSNQRLGAKPPTKSGLDSIHGQTQISFFDMSAAFQGVPRQTYGWGRSPQPRPRFFCRNIDDSIAGQIHIRSFDMSVAFQGVQRETNTSKPAIKKNRGLGWGLRPQP